MQFDQLRRRESRQTANKAVANFRAAVFLAIAAGLLAWSTHWSAEFDLYSVACDQFGYSRQAELFRTNGIVKGLDTRFDAPEAELLIDVAKSVTSDSALWTLAVAPTCGYYNAAVDRVILMFPPGTGLILSLLPENRALGVIFVIGMTLISVVFVSVVASRYPGTLPTVATIAVLGLIQVPMTQIDNYTNPPLVPCVALIPLFAWLTLEGFPKNRWASTALALLLGLVAGALCTIRITNVFLLSGVGLAITVNQKLWQPSMIRRLLPSLIAGFIGFAISIAPLLAANWINAGGPLTSTYAPFYHVINPTLQVIIGHLRYCLAPQWPDPLGPMAFLMRATAPIALVAVILSARFFWRSGAWVGATVCYVCSLVFISMDDIPMPLYYMFPASVMTLSLLTIGLITRTENGHVMARSLVFAVPLVCIALFSCATLVPRDHNAVVPIEVTAPQAIVWAGMTSGTMLSYAHKYTADVDYKNICAYEAIMRRISALGRPQYLIEEEGSSRRALEILKTVVHFERSGDLELLVQLSETEGLILS